MPSLSLDHGTMVSSSLPSISPCITSSSLLRKALWLTCNVCHVYRMGEDWHECHALGFHCLNFCLSSHSTPGCVHSKRPLPCLSLNVSYSSEAFSQLSHLLGLTLGPPNSCSAVPVGHLSPAPPQWVWVAAQKAVDLLHPSSAAPTELLPPGVSVQTLHPIRIQVCTSQLPHCLPSSLSPSFSLPLGFSLVSFLSLQTSSVAQAGLEHSVFLPLPPMCWDYTYPNLFASLASQIDHYFSLEPICSLLGWPS